MFPILRLNGIFIGIRPGAEIFVEITLVSQSRDAMDDFERAVGTFDEILECHLTSGAADYILRIAAYPVRRAG
ncbi:hypothetical protein GCM10011494_29450 [Novosphingobium endophyticum]|uniref:Transcription regulator AsnC/Lrp ligand binding domain-containing protein n=1 Tax=Novosphingobium endophyticum TaxID=1955250 RepID=A0A916TTZ6_9SPHN|nr:hypothetical protein GCM10011494_29450 [Novosphingobium endophyticum]